MTKKELAAEILCSEMAVVSGHAYLLSVRTIAWMATFAGSSDMDDTTRGALLEVTERCSALSNLMRDVGRHLDAWSAERPPGHPESPSN